MFLYKYILYITVSKICHAGMGVSTVSAARILRGQMDGESGEETVLAIDTFPYLALSKVKNYIITTSMLLHHHHHSVIILIIIKIIIIITIVIIPSPALHHYHYITVIFNIIFIPSSTLHNYHILHSNVAASSPTSS